MKKQLAEHIFNLVKHGHDVAVRHDDGDYLSIALDKKRSYEKDGETIHLDGFVIIKESEYKALLSNQILGI